MKQYIRSILQNQKFFGLKSSEDIFWIIFGYCLGRNKANNDSDICFVLAYANFLYKKYPQHIQHYNWGILLRLLSSDDASSIHQFEKEFNLFLLGSEYSIDENPLILKLSFYYEREISLLSILEISSYSLNSLLELQMVLYGYTDSCRINKKEDAVLIHYLERKHQYEERILKELKLPEYGNCLRLLNAWFYSPKEGLQYYRDKIVLYIAQEDNISNSFSL